MKKSKWLKSAQVISVADSKLTQGGFNLLNLFLKIFKSREDLEKRPRGENSRISRYLNELDCDGEFGSGPEAGYNAQLMNYSDVSFCKLLDDGKNVL